MCNNSLQAGDNDGSYMMRPMTEKELQEEEEMQYC